MRPMELAERQRDNCALAESWGGHGSLVEQCRTQGCGLCSVCAGAAVDSGIAVLMSPIIKTNYKDRMRSPAPKPGSCMGTLGQQ